MPKPTKVFHGLGSLSLMLLVSCFDICRGKSKSSPRKSGAPDVWFRYEQLQAGNPTEQSTIRTDKGAT